MIEPSNLFDHNSFPWVVSNTQFVTTQTYPKLSVVVPSYNQAEYLEETLLSIIRQNYPNLELIVIDGGSTDHSVDIIKQYEQHIAYWVSERDRGQSHAINKGFEKASGEWVAWMNSDDCYLERALHTIFAQLPYQEYDFIFGFCAVGDRLETAKPSIHLANQRNNLQDILRFFYHVQHILPSQSVFIRKTLIEKVGLLDESLHYCMDLDWYARMYVTKPRLLEYSEALSFFRINSTTKTGSQQTKMQKEALEIAEKYAAYLDVHRQYALKRIMIYHQQFIINNEYNTNTTFSKLFSICYRTPREAFSDTRFWGSLKRLFLNKLKK